MRATLRWKLLVLASAAFMFLTGCTKEAVPAWNEADSSRWLRECQSDPSCGQAQAVVRAGMPQARALDPGECFTISVSQEGLARDAARLLKIEAPHLHVSWGRSFNFHDVRVCRPVP